MKIAVIGDYDRNRPSHVATSEAIKQASRHLSQKVSVQWLPTRPLEGRDALGLLQKFEGIWGAPGDHDSSLGFINAIQTARVTNIPYLGT